MYSWYARGICVVCPVRQRLVSREHRTRNPVADLIFEDEYLRRGLLEGIGPKQAPVRHAYELSGNANAVFGNFDIAGQNGIHFLVLAGRQWIQCCLRVLCDSWLDALRSIQEFRVGL
jgi:hypothetical protein